MLIFIVGALVAALAAICFVLVSGRVILEHLGWRWIFWSVLPIAILALITGGVALTILVLPIYIERVLDFEVQVAGLVMLPAGVLMGVLGIFVGRIFDAVGARPLLIPVIDSFFLRPKPQVTHAA